MSIEGKRYLIDAGSICTGLRGATVRVERRLDGTIAIRFKDRYLAFKLCTEPISTAAAAKPKPAKDTLAKRVAARQKSTWVDDFWEKPAPSVRNAIQIANATS